MTANKGADVLLKLPEEPPKRPVLVACSTRETACFKDGFAALTPR